MEVEKNNSFVKLNSTKITFFNRDFNQKFCMKFMLFFIFSWIYFFNYNYSIIITAPFYFDKYETESYNIIKDVLIKSNCSNMWNNQREFLHGIIRKYKPKKILEVGVSAGGSSIIILNAIKDIKESHLYSIDSSNHKKIGSCVNKYFPQLNERWTLFKGNITSNYIEQIGKNIDLAFLDTTHHEPGEILDFLLVLPFLSEEAVVVFHDIDHQITYAQEPNTRSEWAPYIIFNLIRGQKYLPSGDGIFNKDIGAVKLEKNQNKYIHDYCRALGGEWHYFPSEIHIKMVINFISKYYDLECLNTIKEAIDFNRNFIKINPIIRYRKPIELKRNINKTLN